MKLLLDQGLPRSTVEFLAHVGIPAEHVSDLGLATATDEAILEVCRHRDAVMVTLDADFHQLLSAAQATSPSVVRIRIEGLRASEIANLLTQLVLVEGELAKGAAISVTRSGIRVRALPLIG